MKKILFVAPRYHTNMHEWIKVLLKKHNKIFINTLISHNVENYSLIKPKQFDISSISKLIIFFFGNSGENLTKGFPSIYKYFFYLKKINPDIIIVRDLSRWFSLVAIILGKFIGSKIIIYSQNKIYNNFSYKRLILHRLVCIIFKPAFMSPIVGKKKDTFKPLKNTFHVPFVGFNHNQKKIKDKYYNILTIGKFVKRKNHEILIQNIIELRKKYPKIRLIIIGEAFEKHHFKLLDELKRKYNSELNKNYIKIITNVSHDDIIHYYKKADLFVLPATEEPASISIIEALANKIPAICSDSCGTAEYIDINKNGTLFKDNDINDLKLKIEHFINLDNSLLTLNNFHYDGDFFYYNFKNMIKKQFGILL